LKNFSFQECRCISAGAILEIIKKTRLKVSEGMVLELTTVCYARRKCKIWNKMFLTNMKIFYKTASGFFLRVIYFIRETLKEETD
jgi:hypothetical protein